MAKMPNGSRLAKTLWNRHIMEFHSPLKDGIGVSTLVRSHIQPIMVCKKGVCILSFVEKKFVYTRNISSRIHKGLVMMIPSSKETG